MHVVVVLSNTANTVQHVALDPRHKPHYDKFSVARRCRNEAQVETSCVIIHNCRKFLGESGRNFETNPYKVPLLSRS